MTYKGGSGVTKDIAALIKKLNKMDLINMYKTFHHKEAKCTFFSNAHGSFSKIDHMVGHKISPTIFKKIEIISRIFSYHSSLKPEINF